MTLGHGVANGTSLPGQLEAYDGSASRGTNVTNAVMMGVDAVG
jgi:hypothetical protein